MVLLIALAVTMALVLGGFYTWARRRGLLATEQGAEVAQGTRGISLLTEAVAYVGAVLVLAGGVAAIGQRWNAITTWGQVAILTGAAVFFFLIGSAVRRVPEPAVQRLVGVVWFLSVVGVAGAAAFATLDVNGNPTNHTALTTGLAATLYSAALWLIRRRALQNLALFAALILTTCGAILAVADPAPSLAFALALWGLGLAWVWLGWRRYIEPQWVTVPSGVLLALVAPIFGVEDHGWLYAIGIATAGAAMATSVPLRNPPLLGLGSVAMFVYVTSTVVQYFGDSLGVPGALAITGVLILCLAVVSARLTRATRPPKPGREKEPVTEESPHRDLPKAS